MSDLDEFWAKQLSGAAENAQRSGRPDVAEYLSLKAENDSLRTAEIEGLFSSIIADALSGKHRTRNIAIEREKPHNFLHRKANLVGELVRLRLGVRCMTVEAGWTRTPSDGFMRMQALAFARITHFGVREANAELVLRSEPEGPKWRVVRAEAVGGVFGDNDLAAHLETLIGE